MVVLPQPLGPEQGEELALLDAEGDAVDGLDGAEALGDAAELEEICAQGRSIMEKTAGQFKT